ncbi:MAG TPA: hypothetical protein VJ743_03860 [Albitalea sp.]|nr:hypothetical protein [Albitalea sp.]
MSYFPRSLGPMRGAGLACCVIALLAHAPLQAADAGKKTAKEPARHKLLLTREELRACMNSKADIDRTKDELVQEQARLTAEKDELVKLGGELKEQLATLDRGNKELVEKYVEANNDRERRIDALETSGKAYDQKVQALQAQRAAYQKDCASKRFDEDDERAIKAGK